MIPRKSTPIIPVSGSRRDAGAAEAADAKGVGVSRAAGVMAVDASRASAGVVIAGMDGGEGVGITVAGEVGREICRRLQTA